ncbi:MULTISPECIES: DUF2971 domain-containing protein [unclassified Legionella]|uniref:DUF2971 domain-containing protein n=1 Tax=unclassified Legionella TaxID=2622702 RepID=UPI003AF84BA8
MYKYRPINEFTKRLIIQGELYFSKFSEQNDPNEAIFDYPSETDILIEQHELDLFPNFIKKKDSPDGRIHLKVSGRTAAKHVRRRIDSMYGILCLTKDPRNLLMFDYYGGGHKGICIGLEWKKLGLIYRGSNKHQLPRQVHYGTTPPLMRSGYDFDKVLYSKWIKYRHEKEFRMIFTPGIYTSPVNVLTAIKQIIFGVAISEENRELVRSWVNNNSLKVEFYQSKLKNNSYELDLINIT